MSEFDDLWENYLSDNLDEAQQERLRQLLEDGSSAIPQAIDKMLGDRELKGLAPADREAVLLERILNASRQAAPVRRINRRWTRAAAVAAILLLLAGIAVIYRPKPAIQTPVAAEIRPGHNGAILTLSNGKRIVLDTAANGALASDNQVKVIKKDGQLSYEGAAEDIVYNTVSTPKGRQWQLTLGDGTKVWLNAASSIRYPIGFPKKQRLVEVTGEAYFEVAQNPESPFIVKTPAQEIQVLGTHFNVNVYDDEPAPKTTLLEGSIKVTSAGKSLLLHPGEQANDLKINKVDAANVIAWINGRFKFDNSDIKTVMRQIARWYDVEVEYKGTIPDYQFVGGTFRNNNLSEVLQVLELSGLHFKLENRKIIVMP